MIQEEIKEEEEIKQKDIGESYDDAEIENS